MNSRFDENEMVLSVLILTVDLKVLSQGDSLLDQVEQVFRNARGKTCGLKRVGRLL